MAKAQIREVLELKRSWIMRFESAAERKGIGATDGGVGSTPASASACAGGAGAGWINVGVTSVGVWIRSTPACGSTSALACRLEAGRG